MIEVEVKLALTNPGLARDVLTKYGYRLVDVCVELDIYLGHPCRDFAKTDEALRLRTRRCRSGKTSYTVTYKGQRITSRDGFKTREEVELKIDEESMEHLKRLLDLLGFTRVISFSKLREVYEGEIATAFLDHLYNVGHFLEIELRPGGNKELLEKVLEELKPISHIVQETYLEICLKTQRCLVLNDSKTW